ncbi:MAG: CapA family protein [Pyrinomonadaceae bacterium]|nr:CapA family protein [Pyrinomonadaceae bacterium]MBP6212265.1 CapA family protein [Pyrinomonadaceae bacterium]
MIHRGKVLPAVAVFITALGVLLVLACQPKAVMSEEPSKVAAAQPAPTPPLIKEPITIAAVGDMMIGSPYPDDTRMPPNDGVDLFKDVTPVLSAADLAFGNLEGPMTDSGVSAKCSAGSTRCYAFRMPTRYAKHFKAAGFDVMSLANNHAGDFGEKGRSDTRSALDSVGIKHAGSDRTTLSTTILEVKGKRVAVIGFGHNNGMPSINDLAGARQLVLETKKKADIVVVSFHGGAEGTDRQNVPNRSELFLGENRGNLPAFAHTVIDAGADLVLGHGPHVMRGMEVYKDRLIAYSLGNFATYGWFRLAGETALTMVLEVKLDADGKFVGGKINAATLEGRGIPTLDPSGTSIRTVRNLSTTDFGVNAPRIADDGTITAK